MTSDIAQDLTQARIPFTNPEGEAILQIVQDYWEQLRRGTRMPLRADIAPNALDYALPHCFIAERVAPQIARFRVAGQGLRDILNMDARGMPISAFLSPEARQAFGPMIETAFTTPRILEIALQTGRSLTRSGSHARMLILPLREKGNHVSRLFGALVTDRPVQLGQRRFDLADHYRIQNKPLRLASGEVRLVATADAPDDRVAAPSSPLPSPPRGLRLVVDNT